MPPNEQPRKPMKVVSVDSYRERRPKKPEGPQPPEGAPLALNKYIKRSFLRMFTLGSGIWKIAKFHKVKPQVVEAELREQLILRGAYQDPGRDRAA